MNALILDSSTKLLYVCLVQDNQIIYEKYIEGKNDHAKNIVFCVDAALKKAKLEVENLDKMIVGYGPGSYTGVRMAVTVGKMISTFKHVPLYTISTLQLMASGGNGICKASIDARRGNAFSCVLDLDKNEMILKEGLYSYEVLGGYSCNQQVKEDSFVVDPFYCIKHCTLVEEPHLLVPNYLRETEAERNLS